MRYGLRLVAERDHAAAARRTERRSVGSRTPDGAAKEQPLWSRARFSYPTLREMSALRSVFSAVAGWTESTVSRRRGGRTGRRGTRKLQFVTDGYFSVVGLRPAYGSTLPTPPPHATAEPQLVAVISESMWEDAFARKDVTNRMLMVNGVAVRIVGVAPPQFNGIIPDGDDGRLMVWLPLSTRATILAAGIGGTNPSAPAALSSVDSSLFQAVGRLMPGVSPERATAAVRVIAANAVRQMAPPRTAGLDAAKPPVVVYDADVVSLHKVRRMRWKSHWASAWPGLVPCSRCSAPWRRSCSSSSAPTSAHWPSARPSTAARRSRSDFRSAPRARASFDNC